MKVPLAWVGGKSFHFNFLKQFLPQSIKIFVEPFCGGASVSLNMLKEKRITHCLFLNDLNKDLINFWQEVANNTLLDNYPVLKTDKEAYKLWMEIRVKKRKGEPLKAWEFYFLHRLSFGSLGSSVGMENIFHKKYLTAFPTIYKTQKLLQSKKIYCFNKDYSSLLKLDSIVPHGEIFFFFDPPYYEASSKLYEFNDINYPLFNKHLLALKNKFLLTLNDCQFIRETFKEFYFLSWERNLLLEGHSKKNKYKELLIANFPLLRKNNA